MKLEFTPALELALERARAIAVMQQAVDVQPRHLLAGILAEEEGNAAALLMKAGIDWSRLRAKLNLPALGEAPANASLPVHPSVAEIMRIAREVAIRHGEEGSISADHALLALLTAIASIRDDLASLGLDFARFKDSIAGESAPLILAEPLELGDLTEEIDTARVLDANANRAREALRVLEDFGRFIRRDAGLSAQLKEMRHELARALSLLPGELLLAGRDTLHDVGTALSTTEEWQRASQAAVIQANAKRLQEALRSLEEHGKILSADFARRIEKLRYQSYTLERALLRGASARERLHGADLCVLVTDAACKHSLAGTVKEAVLGGAGMIQLREKNIDDRTHLARARDLREITRSAGAVFIVNDRPDIARLVQADGVHLGQDDLPIQEARRILGPDALIGVSTHDIEQVRRAVLEGADYLGVGPCFPSQTKDFAAFAGLDFVKAACAETSLPAYAIGGIAAENIDQVRTAGARRIAVSHAICAAADPRAAVRGLRAALLAV